MISWLSANIGTILVLAIVVAVAAGAVCVIRRDKKNGKSSCGAGCAGCPSRQYCHPAPQKKHPRRT